MRALCWRVAEGVLGAVPILATLSFLELSKIPSPVGALTDLLFRVQGWTTLISATFFAVGSTIFSYLLLRGHFNSFVLVMAGRLCLKHTCAGTAASIGWIRWRNGHVHYLETHAAFSRFLWLFGCWRRVSPQQVRFPRLKTGRSVKYGYARVWWEEHNASMKRTVLRGSVAKRFLGDDGQSGT